MPIVGVGIDVVDIDRFAQSLEKTPRLLERLFAESERELPVVSLAARFAAKEALIKALALSTALTWTEAVVHTADNGAPSLRLSGRVAEQAAARGVTSLHVSLSHDGGVATAIVIAED